MDNTLLTARFTRIVAKIPVTFSIGANSYTGTKTTLIKDVKYSEYGQATGYEFSILVPVSSLPAIPAIESTLTISGVTYRILKTELDTLGTTVRLDLGAQFS